MNATQLNRAAAAFAMVLAIGRPHVASAAELRVLCSNGFQAVMQALVPQFEQATKHRVLATYGVSADLKRQVDAGESFDIAVLTPTLIDDAIRRGQIAGDSRMALARSPMAIAIRTGTTKADIRTIEAFKRALLGSKSITYAKEGATGVFFVDLVRRLGLEDALRSTMKPATAGDDVSGAVVRGDAELGVLPVSEIISVRGLDVLGPFPADVQGYVTMVGGVSSRSTQKQVANELSRFLTSPASRSILEQKGMERP
ncbi:MAG: molybdate ABC transporter substrate-binding protein [Phycisphaerae bacterium]